MLKLAQALAIPLALLVLGGCDKASPVAPSGTVVSVSVNPSKIAVDGTASVRVVAVRPNGTPVTPGTMVTFTTTLGSIQPSVATDA